MFDSVTVLPDCIILATLVRFSICGNIFFFSHRPQMTLATAVMLCHRFYLHQSLAKNGWQVRDYFVVAVMVADVYEMQQECRVSLPSICWQYVLHV